MAHLFDTLELRGARLKNRIGVSPMCQYSCTDGLANEWHLVHLGSRAVGGAALVFTEAAAVAPVVRFIHAQGSLAGIQLAHAGRKGSTKRPWQGQGKAAETEGGWSRVVAPSAVAFREDYPAPRELDEAGIAAVARAFAGAAARAAQAGFDVVEIHAAHGYLIHEFLSPHANQRNDRYGGSFENRTRLAREAVEAVRRVWPERHPLFLRISSTDWLPNGWDIEQSVELARQARLLGVDLVDCSAGGIDPRETIPAGPGYQTAFAEQIRREAGIATAALGMITEPAQGDHVIRSGQADLVLMAREFLRDPYWPLRAARELGHAASWPAQYLRAAPAGAPMRVPADPIRAERKE